MLQAAQLLPPRVGCAFLWSVFARQAESPAATVVRRAFDDEILLRGDLHIARAERPGSKGAAEKEAGAAGPLSRRAAGLRGGRFNLC